MNMLGESGWMQFDKAEQGFLHGNGVELANEQQLTFENPNIFMILDAADQ